MNQTLRPEADLHCHLLPDWDDGPRTWDDSLALARASYQSGIRTILVTPHVGRALHGIEEKPSGEIAAATRELELKLRAHGVEMSLVAGAELTMDDMDLGARLKAEPHLTVGGAGVYALIESTRNHWPRFAANFMRDIFFAGVTPIIAHPERYAEVQQNPMILRDVWEQGALTQITARSFLGDDDRRTKTCALALLQAGMVSMVASDAHNARAKWPAQTVEGILEIAGESAAQRIFIDNPRKVLAGEPIYNGEIQEPRPKSFLDKIWKR